MSRRQKTPRKAATYRAARRNAVLRPAEGKPGVWPAIKARYVPYIAKPPIVKFEWGNMLLTPPKSPLVKFRERKQPKTYPYSSERQTGRRRSA